MDTGNQNTFENDVLLKIDAERMAQQIIDRTDMKKGWSMSDIVRTVRETMGKRAAYHARQYIIAMRDEDFAQWCRDSGLPHYGDPESATP